MLKYFVRFFQKNCKIILQLENNTYTSRWTTMGRLIDLTRWFLKKENVLVSWVKYCHYVLYLLLLFWSWKVKIKTTKQIIEFANKNSHKSRLLFVISIFLCLILLIWITMFFFSPNNNKIHFNLDYLRKCGIYPLKSAKSTNTVLTCDNYFVHF